MIEEIDVYRKGSKLYLNLYELDYMINPPIKDLVEKHICPKLIFKGDWLMQGQPTYMGDEYEWHMKGQDYPFFILRLPKEDSLFLEEYTPIVLRVSWSDKGIHSTGIPTSRALHTLWDMLNEKHRNYIMKAILKSEHPTLSRRFVSAVTTSKS